MGTAIARYRPTAFSLLTSLAVCTLLTPVSAQSIDPAMLQSLQSQLGSGEMPSGLPSAPQSTAVPLSPGDAAGVGFSSGRVDTLEEQQVRRAEARRHNLDPAWIAAEIRAESTFNPRARSPADARGLMQVIPATGQAVARRLGEPWGGAESLYDAAVSIRLGTAYLREMKERYGASVLKDIAAGRTDALAKDVPDASARQAMAAAVISAAKEHPSLGISAHEVEAAERRMAAEAATKPPEHARAPVHDRTHAKDREF